MSIGSSCDLAPQEAQRRGAVIFLTGLPGAGKTTIAGALKNTLVVAGLPDVLVLDGDTLRDTLHPRLGFSRADRNAQIARITTLAADAVSRGGIVICAAVAPYDDARRRIRATIDAIGKFVLVHVATPLAVCEARDPKRLYARARRGAIAHFTGVSDPYETPTDADVTVDTSVSSLDDIVMEIVTVLTPTSA